MAVRMDPNASTVAAHSKPAQVDANDFRQFAAMRRADPNDPKSPIMGATVEEDEG